MGRTTVRSLATSVRSAWTKHLGNQTQGRFSMGKYQTKKYQKKEMKQKSRKVLLRTILPRELTGLLWVTQTKKVRRTRKLTALTRDLWRLMMTRRKLTRKARSQKVRMHQRSQGLLSRTTIGEKTWKRSPKCQE